jgi:hypothetical protein
MCVKVDATQFYENGCNCHHQRYLVKVYPLQKDKLEWKFFKRKDARTPVIDSLILWLSEVSL